MEGLSATERLQVVYESEPLESGVAAAALPAFPEGFLRGLLGELLRTSQDVDALAVDYFPEIKRRFAAGMERGQRESLLLEHAPPHALYRALREMFGEAVPPPPRLSEGAARPNPYRRLLVFGVRDAPLFFGRRGKTAELRRMLVAATQPAADSGAMGARLVAVVGPSGSGKSSLVQAGLLADLAREPLPNALYVAAVMRPQGEPLRALGRVLVRLFSPELAASLARFEEEVSAVARKLAQGGRALRDYLAVVLRDERQRLLLVADQLEELYTNETEATRDERRAFVETLLDAAGASGGRLDVVVTLRSDALERTAEDPALQQAVTASGRALLLGALDRGELTEAIREPALLAGRVLPADAVALLVREAEGQPGALPLLQYALYMLWQAWDAAPTRPVAELLQELGGVGGALAKDAEALYLALNPAPEPASAAKGQNPASPPPNPAQLRIRRTCVRLVQVRDGQILGRLRPTLRELVGEGESLADVRATLARFVEGRLLVISGNSDDARVEIGHEWLARHWTRLAEWLKETEKNLPLLLRLSESAQNWQHERRAGWLLWRGDALAELRRALPALEASGSLGSGERAFARACIAGQRRRQLGAVVGVVTLICITIGVGGLAYYAKRQENAARLHMKRAIQVAEMVVFQIDDRLAEIPGGADVRKSLLGSATAMLDVLREEADVDNNVRLLRARMEGHSRRGLLAVTHGSLSTARTEYGAALVLAEDLLARKPSDLSALQDLSNCQEDLGDVSRKTGRLTEAKGWYERVLKSRESLTASNNHDAPSQKILSPIYLKLGDLAEQTGRLADAKGFFERALVSSEKLAAADKDEKNLQEDQAAALARLGELAARTGELAKAKGLIERALKISETLAAAGQRDSRTTRILSLRYQQLGDVQERLGQLNNAKILFQRALEVRESLATADQQDTSVQQSLCATLGRLGDLAREMGQLGESKQHFERSLRIAETLTEADQKNTLAQTAVAISLNKLGDLAQIAGQLPEAKSRFNRSVKISEALAAVDASNARAQRDLAVSLERLGGALVKMGQIGEAKGALNRALKITEALAAADQNDAGAQRDLSLSWLGLAELARQMGRRGEAKVYFERSLKISEALVAEDKHDSQTQRDLAFSLGMLADLAKSEGRLADAEHLARQSLAVAEQLARLDPLALDTQRHLVINHTQLSALLRKRGQRAAAKQEAKAAAALLDPLRERLPQPDAEGLDKTIRSLLQ